MAWHGTLDLAYRREVSQGRPRTVLHDRHDGPLRVLASLYPEAPAICHNVLVHPPGGLVGGDVLTVRARLASGAHALVTTPGATRFYRSTGAGAAQRLHAVLEAEARLEWLPLEAIAYSGCIAENAMRFDLAPGAEMIGWDVLALGLPASGRAFDRGRFLQHIELPGRWLERGLIEAADARLLGSPLGWDGQRAMATVWFAAGDPLPDDRRERLLDAARSEIDAEVGLRQRAGATAVDPGVIVVRALAPRVEAVMALATRVWAAWRHAAWALDAPPPRVWRT